MVMLDKLRAAYFQLDTASVKTAIHCTHYFCERGLARLALPLTGMQPEGSIIANRCPLLFSSSSFFLLFLPVFRIELIYDLKKRIICDDIFSLKKKD